MRKTPETENPAVGATGDNKSSNRIYLVSKKPTQRQPWRARVPFKFQPISAELLASKLFQEAKL